MKVLVLAYDFPPLISIGGQRPYSWYKYLHGPGASVTVVTRHWNSEISLPTDYVKATEPGVTTEKNEQGATIIRAPFKPNLRDKLLLRSGLQKFALLRKLLSLIYAFSEHLFLFADSKSAIFNEAEKEILNNRPDVIIATGEPFILFKYAHRLSQQYNIPWVADYRDTWTANQGNYSQGFLQNRLSDFYRRREQKYISNVLLITTAAPAYAVTLQKTHPGKQVEVIYNGYDESYFTDIENIQPPHDKFVITYGGTIYPHQNLEMFLDGLDTFISQNHITPQQTEINFYGIDLAATARQRLLNYKPALGAYLQAKGRVPYGDLVKKMRASHVLLLLSRKGADWLNAKVFDYLAVKRKVLLVENDNGILQHILNETNGGVALNNAGEVAAFLKTEYDNYKQGLIKDSPVNMNLLKYTRKNQARVLNDLLVKMLNGK